MITTNLYLPQGLFSFSFSCTLSIETLETYEEDEEVEQQNNRHSAKAHAHQHRVLGGTEAAVVRAHGVIFHQRHETLPPR